MEDLKKQSGITLIILVITVIVLSITTATVITSSSDNLKVKNLNNLYTDIKSLNDKVFVYYNKYGKLPIKSEYSVGEEFWDIKNYKDDNKYYVIDVSKLNNLVLTRKVTWEDNDVYIINNKSHTIYYPKGITFEENNYYSLPVEHGIPITNAEELAKMGTGQSATIYGKGYILSANEKYMLTNNIEYTGDYTEIIERIQNNNIQIIGNGYEIEVTVNGTTKYYVEEYNYCNAREYSNKANELIFENQNISKTYSTEEQTASITRASNGTGIYTYTEVSEKSGSTNTSYINISGETIIIAANTPAGTYTYVIRATDSNSGATKDATYTITVGQEEINPVTDLTVSTSGIVTWTESSNATGYEISVDNINWTEAQSGVNYLSTITATTGSRTVYVRAVNSDTVNYQPSTNVSKAVTVIALTTNSNNTNYGTLDSSTYNVISGATYSTNSNVLTVKGGNTTLKTITATKKEAIGYTTNFDSWSSTTGTINAATTITANFERITNNYTITYNLDEGSQINPKTSYTVEDENFTLVNPTKTGYTFKGWSGTGLTGDTNTSVTIEKGSTGNRTYTANWTANTVTVTFNANGGSVATPTKSVTYDGTYGDLPTPTKTGYTFTGWNGKNLLNLEVQESMPSDTTGENTTKRTFIANTYVIGIAYNNYYNNYDKIKNSLNINNNKISFTTSSGYGVAFPILSSANKNYTFSYNISSTNQGISSIMYYKEDGTLIDFIRTNGNGNHKIQFTTPEDTYYLVVELCSGGIDANVEVDNIQLEEGSTATSYEPYYVTKDTNVTQAKGHTLTAHWTANELTFANQTVTKTFSTSAQTQAITAASNGTGTYTYSEVSEKNSGGTATSYISISGTTITIAANTPANTYTYVIRAKDSNSLKTKDATYTIKVNKAQIAIPTSPAAKTYTGSAQSSGITTPAHTSIVTTPELVINGNGSYRNNTNFSAWTYDSANSYNGSTGSFKNSNTATTLITDTSGLFALSTDGATYNLAFDAKTANGSSKYYSMIMCYDIDKKLMYASHYMFINGSTTTLSQELKNGDTVVHFTNLSGWNTKTTYTYQKGFIFWNYTNSKGYTYPAETYSRNFYNNMYAGESSINVAAGTITLSSAWTGGTIPAGTAVSQHSDGGVYKYMALVNTKLSTTWTHYSASMTGTDYSGANALKFPPYAVYGSVGFLWNREGSGDTGYITNVSVTGKSITSATNVGTYSIAYKLDDTANYVWSDGTTTIKTVPWIINPYDITSNSTVGAIANQTYTGSAIKPNPTITSLNKTLTNGTDYSLTYKNNVNAGTATVYIVGKGNFKGSKSTTFKINKANPTVTLSATSGSVDVGEEATFTATPNLDGKWNVTTGNARYVTISSPAANAAATANTATTIKYKGVAVTTSAVAITVKFTPTNTNYNEVSKTFSVTVNESDGIPTGYQKIEYIQANGTQWIDTGVALNGNYELRVDGCMLANKSGVLLNGYANTANRMGMTFFATSNKVGYYWFGVGYTENTNLNISLTERFTLIQTRSGAHIYQGDKHVGISYSGATTAYSSMNIYIFNTDANANYKNGIIYEAIISDTTTYDDSTGEYKEIRHFIPCKRKSDGVIGLYDTVGKKFYTNSGTGTFVAGPNV